MFKTSLGLTVHTGRLVELFICRKHWWAREDTSNVQFF